MYPFNAYFLRTAIGINLLCMLICIVVFLCNMDYYGTTYSAISNTDKPSSNHPVSLVAYTFWYSYVSFRLLAGRENKRVAFLASNAFFVFHVYTFTSLVRSVYANRIVIFLALSIYKLPMRSKNISRVSRASGMLLPFFISMLPPSVLL